MPDVTDEEIVVTSYVYNRFGGTGYSTYAWNGGTVYTFGTATNERWFDLDNDGHFDYGRRDEGNGHWSTCRGFGWQSDHTPEVPEPHGPEMEELEPNGLIAQPEKSLFPETNSFESNVGDLNFGLNSDHSSTQVLQDGWIL